DEVRNVRGRDRVDAPITEQRQEHPHGAAMLQSRVLGNVDAALLPSLRRLAQRRGGGGLARSAEHRYALTRKLAGDPASADGRFALRGERAAVADPCLSSTESILDAIALAAVLRRTSPDPDASHPRSRCPCHWADAVVAIREVLDE